MTLVLDAGAFIAVQRRQRRVITLLAREHRAGRKPVTHGGVIGQVWRGSARQAGIGRLLAGVRVVPVDEALGRAAGALRARTRTVDVIDATLVLLAKDGDEILTADPDDIAMLASASGIHIDIVRV